jgi:SAM-dependent methyltransferase
MANERKTENIVRDALRKLGYYDNAHCIIEEQSSENTQVAKFLQNASKKGTGIGKPEFIIRSKENPSFIIIIECKASVEKHESKNKDKYADYAVDGALLYASFLSKGYDVLAIGVSGQSSKELKVSHFLLIKGSDAPAKIFDNKILSYQDYHAGYVNSDLKFNEDYKALLAYSKKLNDLLHKNKVKESQRSLLISGILISLGNNAFRKGYKGHRTAKDIANALVETVASELSSSDIPIDKVSTIKHAYSFITNHTTLSKDKEFFIQLIEDVDQHLNTFMRTHKYFDTLGQFYIEFLRYANSDKGLGIVLTPPHITELFADIAEVGPDSVVLDNCCGTGGFLISAMQKMVKLAKGDTIKEKKIKTTQLVGIEYQDDIYALAVSNMVIHGDGKSNVIQGSCFELANDVKDKFNPNVALLNPPYKDDIKELEFVLNALETLEIGGKCAVILPMSCALAQKGPNLELKKKLFAKHTLEAVMSMPDELFHNSEVGVVTCVMVFTAHKPHPSTKKTWFGYWKDDGFVKVKNKGRIDRDFVWEDKKQQWLNAFHNREDVAGESVKHAISADDEWCAEAYMETDYSSITEAEFLNAVKNYSIFKVLNS